MLQAKAILDFRDQLRARDAAIGRNEKLEEHRLELEWTAPSAGFVEQSPHSRLVERCRDEIERGTRVAVLLVAAAVALSPSMT